MKLDALKIIENIYMQSVSFTYLEIHILSIYREFHTQVRTTLIALLGTINENC